MTDPDGGKKEIRRQRKRPKKRAGGDAEGVKFPHSVSPVGMSNRKRAVQKKREGEGRTTNLKKKD